MLAAERKSKKIAQPGQRMGSLVQIHMARVAKMNKAINEKIVL